MKKRVLFHVQHLLGIGHLKRAEILAQAMAKSGLEVTVAYGGRAVPEVPFKAATLARFLLRRSPGRIFPRSSTRRANRSTTPGKPRGATRSSRFGARPIPTSC